MQIEQKLRRLEAEWSELKGNTAEADAIFKGVLELAVSQTQSRTGPGTVSARLSFLLDSLAERFPESHKPFASDPPELRFLEAIDRALGTSDVGHPVESLVTRHDAKIALKQLANFVKQSKDQDIELMIGDNLSVLSDYVKVSRERHVDEGIWDESSMRLHVKEAMDEHARGAPYENTSPHYVSFQAGFKSGFLYQGSLASSDQDKEDARCWRTLVAAAESRNGFLLPNGSSIQFGVENHGILKQAVMQLLSLPK
jgi:hypothetical protein